MLELTEEDRILVIRAGGKLTLADYDRLASEMDAAVGTTLQIHCTAR